MIKYIDISPYDQYGQPTTSEIRQRDISQTMNKIAKYESYTEEMRDFISNIEPKEDVAYLLIAALGDQNWGSNRNSDFWPTEALSHDGHDYGFRTYVDNGHWFKNHENKDLEKSYGKVVFSVYNKQMCRIELIVQVDLTKDHSTKERLKNNEIIQTSMGANVNYDICKVCHPNWIEFYKIPEPEMVIISKSKSLEEIHDIGDKYGVDLSYINSLNSEGGAVGIHSTTKKYCYHMKHYKNKLLPSGERVAVVNLRPRFFDISDVRVNADKSSFVLDKVASLTYDMSEEDENKLVSWLINNEKIAEQKKADESKRAAINKEVPGEVLTDDIDLIKEYYAKKVVPEIMKYEKEIPDSVVDVMAQKYSLAEILSTFMALGMFPHPREFQRVVLVQTGNHDGLSQMSSPENILTPSILDAIQQSGDDVPELDFGVGCNAVNNDLASMLAGFMQHRSYYRPLVNKRIIMIKNAEYKDTNSYMTSDVNPPRVVPALVASIGGLYLAAKLTGDKNLNGIIEGALRNKLPVAGALASAVLLYGGIRMHNKEMNSNNMFNAFKDLERQKKEDAYNQLIMQKTSGSAATIALPVLGAYLWGGHAMNKMQKGEEPGAIGMMAAKHPLILGLAGAALIHPATRKALLGGMKKTSEMEKEAGNPGKILYPLATIAAPLMGTHLSAANTVNKAVQGRPYNKAEGFIAKHPLATGIAGSIALTPALRKALYGWGKYIVKGASLNYNDLEQLEPIEQDKYICAAWEN